MTQKDTICTYMSNKELLIGDKLLSQDHDLSGCQMHELFRILLELLVGTINITMIILVG